MKKILSCLLFLSMIFCLNSSVFAEEKIIKLKDGIVLRGEILSKEGEIYKVSSTSLGLLCVKDSDILSIDTAIAVQTDEMHLYQQRILKDTNIMKDVQSLSEDKEVLDLLSDSRIKDAIMNQDIEFLKNDKKFQKVMNNTLMKKIIGEVIAVEKKTDKAGEGGFEQGGL